MLVKMRGLKALRFYNGITIFLDRVVIAQAPTLELAKQEATIIFGNLQLRLLTLEVEK